MRKREGDLVKSPGKWEYVKKEPFHPVMPMFRQLTSGFLLSFSFEWHIRRFVFFEDEVEHVIQR